MDMIDEEQIILKADIEISTQNEASSLSYTLYYGSVLDLETSFILRMYEYQHALGDNAIFIPRIITF